MVFLLLERELKFKETCAIHDEALSSAEVLHRPFEIMNQTFTNFTILQYDESAEGTHQIVNRMSDLGVTTILATTDCQSAAKVHLHIDVKIHPICFYQH